MEHRSEPAQTYIGKWFFLLLFFFFTTSIQNSTDKSMKVILFTKTSVEGEGGGAGQACCAGFSSVMKMVMMKT